MRAKEPKYIKGVMHLPCSTCKEYKPTTEYSPTSQGKYKLYASCKACKNTRVKAGYTPGKNKHLYAKDPDKFIVATRNNQAKRLGIPGVITLEYWLSIKTKCYYCGTTEYPLQVDHVVPLSKGGTNEESNIVAACEFCNRAKNDHSEAEYREWLRTIGK
jgi:5-methylcytosine-specific restriction endonuclease McrA